MGSFEEESRRGEEAEVMRKKSRFMPIVYLFGERAAHALPEDSHYHSRVRGFATIML